MSDRWDRHFIEKALVCARHSKDPATRVGAVIIGQDLEPISDGFNGLPRGLADTPERLNDRELKLKLTIHAEVNAILNAARRGHAVRGGIMYMAATDDTGMIWGGPPCTRCTVDVIQAGIIEVVTPPFKPGPSKWKDDIEFARGLLAGAGVRHREVIL